MRATLRIDLPAIAANWRTSRRAARRRGGRRVVRPMPRPRRRGGRRGAGRRRLPAFSSPCWRGHGAARRDRPGADDRRDGRLRPRGRRGCRADPGAERGGRHRRPCRRRAPRRRAAPGHPCMSKPAWRGSASPRPNWPRGAARRAGGARSPLCDDASRLRRRTGPPYERRPGRALRRGLREAARAAPLLRQVLRPVPWPGLRLGPRTARLRALRHQPHARPPQPDAAGGAARGAGAATARDSGRNPGRLRRDLDRRPAHARRHGCSRLCGWLPEGAFQPCRGRIPRPDRSAHRPGVHGSDHFRRDRPAGDRRRRPPDADRRGRLRAGRPRRRGRHHRL